MKTITLVCEWCKKPYEKSLTIHNYDKLKRISSHKHNFCSQSCSSFYTNDKIKRGEIKRKPYQRRTPKEKLLRKFSPFKYIAGVCKIRNEKHQDGFDIDENYLKELWQKQNGICPYTGIKMVLLYDSVKDWRDFSSLRKASLDRIDSSKGYVKGNIEFVCLAINRAKNDKTKEEFVDFLKEVRSFYSSTTL